MEPDLLPCPFCGSTEVGLGERYDSNGGDCVGCNKCLASGPEFRGKWYSAELKATAVAAWNKRADRIDKEPTATLAAILATQMSVIKVLTFLEIPKEARVSLNDLTDKVQAHINILKAKF